MLTYDSNNKYYIGQLKHGHKHGEGVLYQNGIGMWGVWENDELKNEKQ